MLGSRPLRLIHGFQVEERAELLVLASPVVWDQPQRDRSYLLPRLLSARVLTLADMSVALGVELEIELALRVENCRKPGLRQSLHGR
jgi:hypothetical protein